jgi:glycine hydroxymethyltransferase
VKDTKISELIKKEEHRQRVQLQLIPSENYASKNVLNPLSSVLSNKYSEGKVNKRFYQGNTVIDEIEQLAIDRAKKLFGAEHANVQPLSGTPMNLAVYFALLKPGDKIMYMDMAAGGHLSHGSTFNVSGVTYNAVPYNVNKQTQTLDYNEILNLAKEEKPQLIIAGASAYPKQIDFKKFGQIANAVNALFLADISHIAGLIVAGEHMSPVPYAHVVTTTTHKTLRGPRGGLILCKQEFAEKIDKAVFPGTMAGPHNNAIASKAIAFYEAGTREFKEYIHQVVVNCRALAKNLTDLNYKLVAGGTDNHLMLMDFTGQDYNGRDVAVALEKANIITNFNLIPFDTASPFKPSGLRLGTPAITSRGMVEEHMTSIASFIDKAIKNMANDKVLADIAKQVEEFTKPFTVPGLDD